MTELKPCPFCGDKAELIEPNKYWSCYHVHCMNECCIGWVTIKSGFLTAEKAAESWNTRMPVQATAATLGRPTFDANLEQALSFMRIWISDDAHLGDSELSAAFEKAEGLRKLDAIESAIAATLGGVGSEVCGGKLTAEQVREAIERNFGKVAVLDDGGPVEWRDDWVCKVGIDYRSIADELNAALGSETCENANKDGYSFRFECSKCGYSSITTNCRTRNDELPNFCPACRARIRKAVKR